MKEKHQLDILIKKKDVLESSTEYEITVINPQSTKSFNDQLLLNEFNVNDIETFVKSNSFILDDQDLKTSSHEHHQNNFDDFKLIEFPVM
jgi:hypothetical protein